MPLLQDFIDLVQVAALLSGIPGFPQRAIGIGENLGDHPMGKGQRITKRQGSAEALATDMPSADLQARSDSLDRLNQSLRRGIGLIFWRWRKTVRRQSILTTRNSWERLRFGRQWFRLDSMP